MKNNKPVIFLIVCTLMLVNLACGFGSFGSEEPQNDSEAEPLRIEAGGFSFEPLPDYKMEQFYGLITLTAPDAAPEVGPSIMLVGAVNLGETNESSLESFLSGLDQDAYQASEPKTVRVNGVEGIQVELSGTHNGTAVRGLYITAADEVRTFTLLGIAPEERWNNEVKKLLDNVYDSLVFFPPDEDGPMSNLPESAGGELRQWAAAAQVSSQYEASNFAAEQLIGEPNTPACGDFPTSWSSELDYTQEWARLTYFTPVIPTLVNIHQTFNPSQVVQVNLIDDSGISHTVYESTPVKLDCPYVLSIPIEGADYYAIAVEILVDQSVLGISWNEIDAVELVGKAGDWGSQPPATADEPVEETVEEPIEEPQPAAEEPSAPSSESSSASYDYLPTTQYRAYVQVVISETYTPDLSGLFGVEGKEETGLKPRPDADKTFSFDLGDGKKAYVGVTTSGMVYKKSIPDAYYPDPAALSSPALYDELVAMFNDTGAIEYAVIADMLGSPGFPMEAYLTAEDELKEQFSWTTMDGYYISGFFVNGVLTGAWALSYGNR